MKPVQQRVAQNIDLTIRFIRMMGDLLSALLIALGILKYALTGKPFHHALIIPGDLRAISKHIHEPVQFPVALQHFCHV